MRPEILYPFFADTISLPGVGARIATLLEKIIGRKVLDLFWHLPVDIIDRSASPVLNDIKYDQIVTVEVTIDKHEVPPRNTRRPYRVCGEKVRSTRRRRKRPTGPAQGRARRPLT